MVKTIIPAWGGGIVYGFTAYGLDFATGNDGPALSLETHNRNLVLVHSNDGVGGYFVVFDEVTASSGDKVKSYLHPANQSSVEVIDANRCLQSKNSRILFIKRFISRRLYTGLRNGISQQSCIGQANSSF